MSDAPGGAGSNADEAGALRLVAAEVPATPAVTMPSEVTAANGTWATPQTMSFQEEAEAAWREMGVVVPWLKPAPPDAAPLAVPAEIHFPTTSPGNVLEGVALSGGRSLSVAIAKPVTDGDKEGARVHVLAGTPGGALPDSKSLNMLGTDQGWIVRVPDGSYFFFGDTWLYFGGQIYEEGATNNDCMGFIASPIYMNEHTPPPATQILSASLDGIAYPSPVTIQFPNMTMVGEVQGIDMTPTAPFAIGSTIYSFFKDKNKTDDAYLGHVLGLRTPNTTNFVLIPPMLTVGNGAAAAIRLAPDPSDVPPLGPLKYADYFGFLMSYPCPEDILVPVGSVVPLGEIGRDELPLSSMTQPVFAWGRMWVSAIASDPGGTSFVGGGLRSLRLMVFDAADLGKNEPLQLWYFGGYGADGKQPIWVPFQGPTTLAIGEAPFPVIDEAEEPVYVGSGTVSYDRDLKLWIMLYGGHPGVTSGQTDGSGDGLYSPAYVIDDQGVYLRVAAKPWGPWSPRQRVWPTRTGSGWDFTNNGPATPGLIMNQPPDLIPGGGVSGTKRNSVRAASTRIEGP